MVFFIHYRKDSIKPPGLICQNRFGGRGLIRRKGINRVFTVFISDAKHRGNQDH